MNIYSSTCTRSNSFVTYTEINDDDYDERFESIRRLVDGIKNSFSPCNTTTAKYNYKLTALHSSLRRS